MLKQFFKEFSAFFLLETPFFLGIFIENFRLNLYWTLNTGAINIHKVIIDRDVFERAQEITKSNNLYERARGAAELIVSLKRLFRCGHCGGSIKQVFTTKGKNGTIIVTATKILSGQNAVALSGKSVQPLLKVPSKTRAKRFLK